MALPEVLAAAAAGRFRPLPGFLNRGFTREASWVRFSFARAGDITGELFLCLGVPFLDEVTVYCQEGADPTDPGAYREDRLGDRVPVAERPVRHPHLVVPLPASDAAPRTAHVRVRTSGTHLVHGAVRGTDAFLSWTQGLLLVQGGYLAVALSVGLINLIFAVRARDRTYGYYAMHVLSLFAAYSGLSGVLAVAWPAAAHRLSDPAASLGTLLAVASFALFVARLFETRGGSRWVHGYLVGVALLGTAAAATYPLGSYPHVVPWVFLAGLGLATLSTGLAVRAAVAGAPSGRLFLTAFGLSNAAGVVVFLRVLGFVPATGVTVHALQACQVVHLTLMTLALTQRVKAAEQGALAASREAERRAMELARGMTGELRGQQAALERALAAERGAREDQARLLELIAHEYRTPLAILRANLDLLRLKDGTVGVLAAPYLEKMDRAAVRLVELFEAARGRASAQATPVRRSPVALAPPLAELKAEAASFWGARFHLVFDGAEGATVAGDRGQLRTALWNLVENAVKYSASSCPVVTTLGAEAGQAVVTVTNPGTGLSEAEAEEAFEKYRRGPNSAGTAGLGLGLHLVRQIVDGHGGTVRLIPGGPGRVDAEVRLPLYPLTEDRDAERS